MIAAPRWLTSHLKTPYPFVGPAVPVALEDADFQTLFVDAYIRYNPAVVYGGLGAREVHLRLDRFVYVRPSSASSISSSASSESSQGPEPHTLILLSWADGLPFLDTEAPGTGQLIFSERVWGDWLILEWIYLRDIDDATDYDRVARFILDNRRVDSFTYPVEPVAAYIVPGLIEHSSSRVTTLRLINHSGTESVIPDPSLVSPLAEVDLVAGYNTKLSLDTEATVIGEAVVPVRAATRIMLDFEPGAGLGKYPGCEEPESALRFLNKVGPDQQGHFVLAPESCYFMERPLATAPNCLTHIGTVVGVEAAKLKLRNWCYPCCKCDDYVDSYDKERQVWTALAEAVSTYNSVKAEVTALIASFGSKCGETENCTEVVPHIISYMKHSWLLTGQAIVYNVTQEDLQGLYISLALVTPKLTYTYVPNSAWVVTPEEDRRVSDAAGYAQAITLGEPVNAGTSVMFEYEVYFPEQSTRVGGMPVYWILSGTLGSKSFYTTAVDWLQGPFNH